MNTLKFRRLSKELKELTKSPPDGIRLVGAADFELWQLEVSGAPGTLYAGETFILQITFGPDYPLKAPEVVFIESIPINEHVYSNGHICLSILYDEWSPALQITSVCLSILSMLSSATRKV